MASTGRDSGEIFVITVEDDLVVEVPDEYSGGTVKYVDFPRAYKLLQDAHGDSFDFVTFVQEALPDEVSFGGNYSQLVFSDVTGLGDPLASPFDYRAAWGSNRLLSAQVISNLSRENLMHETCHQWGAYAYHQEDGVRSPNLHENHAWFSSSQPEFHWGSWFDNADSCLDYDGGHWELRGPNTWEWIDLAGGAVGLHRLDRYLMGVLGPDAVATFRYVKNPVETGNQCEFTGGEVPVTIGQVIAEEGPRVPSADQAPRTFRQAFVLLTTAGGPDPEVLETLRTYLAEHVDGFRRAAWSRAVIDSSLTEVGRTDVRPRAHQPIVVSLLGGGVALRVDVAVVNRGPGACRRAKVALFAVPQKIVMPVYPNHWLLRCRLGPPKVFSIAADSARVISWIVPPLTHLPKSKACTLLVEVFPDNERPRPAHAAGTNVRLAWLPLSL